MPDGIQEESVLDKVINDSDSSIGEKELVKLRDEYKRQLDSYAEAVQKELERRGIPLIERPLSANDEHMLRIPADITEISDRELGRRYFAVAAFAAYIGCQASQALIRKTMSFACREAKQADAQLMSDRSAVDDRKAESTRDLLFRAWNMVYLIEDATYTRLKETAASWSKLCDAYSREMTRRTDTWERERG